jgi:hypothetical protein
MTYQPAWYPSPIALPEQTIGKFSIRHRFEKGSTPVVGMRQAYTRGIGTVTAKLSKPLRIHELYKTNGNGTDQLLMTDLPEELNQIEEMLYNVKPQGRVLVGGLGLGIVARRVAEIVGVESVTVVEISRSVIQLCAPKGTANFRTVRADILKFLTTHKEPFDFYLLDTWGGTNEMTWWGTVLPLRRAIRQRWGKKPVVHCWAEDIMWGQVKRQLMQCPIPHWYYVKELLHMSDRQAEQFLAEAGLPTWEKRYGKAIDNRKEKA